ncbi:hypothetical protein M407DRAFT_231060 [Tulasnella calospora MUT 4182]|uniref:Carboxylic ester hydrolase n=1 Tax=Tulasnella calospora MUT 4182 TaxID=1051891 RepID=A0A0C3QML6_9AGAM|nr:hypothetical protein M407DRAFT_231060 [Tulasnella calospora MUT 4182]
MKLIIAYIFVTSLLTPVLAAPARRLVDRSIQLDQAQFVGASDGVVDRFLSIPFALPPTGDRRLRQPEAHPAYTGTYDVHQFGPSCPQNPPINFPGDSIISAAANAIFEQVWNVVGVDSEDCLTLNVIRPTGITNSTKLPVVVMGTPVIWVSVNYRVNMFGFPVGKAAKDAGIGNLGLLDQRVALKWVQKYISTFGGDPSKVTLWGQSAGAISIAFQMIHDGENSENLYRAAFMESGGPLPIGYMDDERSQNAYDLVLEGAACSNATDTLECLRGVPYATLKKAIAATPGLFDRTSVMVPFIPRVDGTFFKETPLQSVQKGNVVNIPFISGNMLDEGTLFSFGQTDVKTTQEFKDWVSDTFSLPLSDAEMDNLLKLYPSDITQGSPFETASFQGDLVFQGPRRFMLNNLAGRQSTWSYLNKQGSGVFPFLGSFHALDLLAMYSSGPMQDYLINFVNTLDPNNGPNPRGLPNWPKYVPKGTGTNAAAQLVLPKTDLGSLSFGVDNYREDAIALIQQASLKFPATTT